MPVLAVDQSLTGTGYAWRKVTYSIDEGHRRELMVGTIIQKERKGMRRLAVIHDTILEQARLSGARLAVFEGYAFGHFPGAATRAHSLGEIGGILKHALWSRGIDLLIVPPSCLKNFMLGSYKTVEHLPGGKKRKIKVKELVKAAAEQHAGRAFATDDMSDAYGLLLMGEGKLNPRLLPRLRTNYQRIALESCAYILGRNRTHAAVCN